MAHFALMDIIIIPLCFAIIYWSGDIFNRAFCGIIIAGMIWLNIREYDFWRTRDPDRLHTERAWLDKIKLDYEISNKGGLSRLPDKDDIIC